MIGLKQLAETLKGDLRWLGGASGVTIRRRTKWILAFFLHYLGIVGAYRLFACRGSNIVKILVYHRVTDTGDEFLPRVSAKQFEAQMRYLIRSYCVMGMDDLYDSIKGRREIARNSIGITFDDGYEDVYENALPILRRYNLPATVFLTSGFLGNRGLPWTDRIYYMFARTKATELRVNIRHRKQYGLGTERQRIYAREDIKSDLKRVREDERLRILQELAEKLGVEGPTDPDLMLSWDQVRAMQQESISFGSHTVTHPLLTKITTERARYEITESKRELERSLGKKIGCFAYPSGQYNEEIKKMVEEAGYSYALTSGGGANNRDTDSYALKRIHIEYGPIWFFSTEVSGLLDSFRSLFRMRRD